jgi:hypothetical protein
MTHRSSSSATGKSSAYRVSLHIDHYVDGVIGTQPDPVLAVVSAVNRGFVGLDTAARRRLLAQLEAGAPARPQPREGLA